MQGRRNDIPLLIRHFIERLSAEGQKRVGGVSPQALAAMMAYDWPGNVRELQNAVEHGFVLASGLIIGLEHLPAGFQRPPSAAQEATSLAELERNFILTALEKNGYNREATARQLGIHKTTFFRKVRKLGIQLPSKDGRSSPQGLAIRDGTMSEQSS